jgi:hypothetical protein
VTEFGIVIDFSEEQCLKHSFPRGIIEFGMVKLFKGLQFSQHLSRIIFNSSGITSVSIN